MMLAPCLFASVKGGTSEKGGFATEERDGANASNMNQLFAGSRAFTDKRRSKACAHSIVSDYRLQLRAASNRYTSAIGRSSTQHMDQHFLLKKNGDPVMARREECILSLLRRASHGYLSWSARSLRASSCFARPDNPSTTQTCLAAGARRSNELPLGSARTGSRTSTISGRSASARVESLLWQSWW